ncbi:MAG: CDP-archaeol synthase [Gammaproteobacteria bacterium]|nr:CDP-archaeol synthase [Gammaproteobacteria bacterium]
MVILQVLILLGMANGGPIVARVLLGERFNRPLDGGKTFIDGTPIFGSTKTVRGLLASLLMGAAGAAALGLPASFGAWFAAAAMLGDLFSSFIKRRMGVASSSPVTGLDQIPEALFPALAALPYLDLRALDVAIIVTLFFLLDIAVSPVLYRLRIRKIP